MQRFLLGGIRLYRRHLSRLKRRPTCRFVPTCSEYAATAIMRYGAGKGSRMAIGRICRCHPFAQGGYDPVPLNPLTTLRRE